MAWIAGVAGMATSAAGSESAAASTVEGARAKADIEAMNRQYQRQIFNEQMEANKPFYDAGLRSLPMLEQFRTQGGVDLSNNPLFQMQQSAGQEGLDMAGGVRPQGREFFGNALNASSQGPAYQRLLDLQKVGLGAAGEAGNYAQGQGAALSSSFQRGGNAMLQGAASAANQRQSLYGNLAGQAGAMPAYFDYARRTQ